MSIRAIIFDLDGVLVDARELHYKALNEALNEVDYKYVISREDHLKIFDGLPTKKKLTILTETKGLDPTLHQKISDLKQKKTIQLIDELISEDLKLKTLLEQLITEGYILYVASNSIRETIIKILTNKGIINLFSNILSNEDVQNPKPHPEIYLQTVIKSGLKPKECLVIEDSKAGRQAAIDSGCYLCAVEDYWDVTYEKIHKSISSIKSSNVSVKWNGDDFNILIPMAGAGSRFSKAGYTFPKPLIEVKNKPMIQVVSENLGIKAKFIYIVQKEHYEKYNLKYLLNLITPGCEIVITEGLTEGAACTTLLAKELINDDKHLLIANSDQFIEWNPNDFYYSMIADKVDGGILTFQSTHPKWSFVSLDENGYINHVAEKKPISDIATVGIYYWNKGSDYVKYAEQMISKNIRVNNEFYVAPVYNEAIADNKKLKHFNIEKMWGIGTPEDLNYFLENYNL